MKYDQIKKVIVQPSSSSVCLQMSFNGQIGERVAPTYVLHCAGGIDRGAFSNITRKMFSGSKFSSSFLSFLWLLLFPSRRR